MAAPLSRTTLAGGVILLYTLLPAAWFPHVLGAKNEPERLPPPKQALPESIVPADSLFSGYYRTSRYDVWQLYGVDRQGKFRPRVILSPSGAYYLYNGAPYPFWPMHQLDFMPYVVD
jgi:hypothetical protein